MCKGIQPDQAVLCLCGGPMVNLLHKPSPALTPMPPQSPELRPGWDRALGPTNRAQKHSHPREEQEKLVADREHRLDAMQTSLSDLMDA